MKTKLRLLALTLIGIAGFAHAGIAAAETHFRIPAGELRSALKSFITQSGEELVYRVDDLRGVTTKGVEGSLQHDAALRTLLRDTGFEARWDDSGAAVIVRLQPPDETAGSRTPAEASTGRAARNTAGAREPLSEIVVTGNIVGNLGLDGTSSSGSRLGLSLFDTPASIEVIDSSVMQARGYQKLKDAISQLAGVSSGDRSSATSASAFAMRGFERSQIMMLRDGIWLGPTSMVMRQQNTFNLDRVEVLRGPASVLHGNGAVAGNINTVNKSAEVTEETSVNALMGYGRYGSYNLGIGVGGPVGEDWYYRADLSRFGSDGYMPNSGSYSTNFTGSLLWQAAEDFSLKLSFDYLDDDTSNYWGTPLVPVEEAREPMPGVIRTTTGHTMDRAMRFENFNTRDSFSTAEQTFFRIEANWDITDNIWLQNKLYRYRADRHWKNAETYVYCEQDLASTFPCSLPGQLGQVQRYLGYFILDHEQKQFGNRLTVNVDTAIGDREARLVFGHELNDIDFVRTRGFRIDEPPVEADSVDPYDVDPGVYGPIEWRAESPTDIRNSALFGEAMFELTPSLKLVMAVRYEELDLDRSDIDLRPGPGFGQIEDQWARTFRFWGYRYGLVWALREDFVLYAQSSNAKDPVGRNIFLVQSDQNFDLTDATSWEAGWKANFFSDTVEATFAYYEIDREDVSERHGRDDIMLIGARTSKGVEFSTTMTPVERLDLGMTLAYTDAEILPSENAVVLANKTPANVPEWTASAYASYHDLFGLPLEIGGSVRYVDDRFADHENTTEMLDYTVTNAFVGWSFSDNVRVSAHVDNLFDEEYLPWSDPAYVQNYTPGVFAYANQLAFGSPRTYGVTLEAGF